MRYKYETLKAYANQYPGDSIGPFEADDRGRIKIYSKELGKSFLEPHICENDEIFLDRLERSKKAGRNLFYEEWEPWDPLDGVNY